MPIIAFFGVISIVAAIIYGWVLNIISLVSVAKVGWDGNEVEILLRVVGVFVAFLGSIFGYAW